MMYEYENYNFSQISKKKIIEEQIKYFDMMLMLFCHHILKKVPLPMIITPWINLSNGRQKLSHPPLLSVDPLHLQPPIINVCLDHHGALVIRLRFIDSTKIPAISSFQHDDFVSDITPFCGPAGISCL